MNWNPRTRVIISDVDDTIAPVFQPASPQMIAALQRLLEDGILLLLVSGQSLGNIFDRVLRPLDPALRKRVLVAHCNGAEVFDFDAQGRPGADPLYAVTAERSLRVDPVLWRTTIEKLITQFDLRPWPVMDLGAFRLASGGDPHAVMMDDRRVQISLDFANWLFDPPRCDIRSDLVEEANRAFRLAGLDLEGKTAGSMAVDFIVSGVDKGLPITKFIAWGPEFRDELPARIVLGAPEEVEVWGDQFSSREPGADVAMALALPASVRSISFRPCELHDAHPCPGLRVWSGTESLHAGLLGYLSSRPPAAKWSADE